MKTLKTLQKLGQSLQNHLLIQYQTEDASVDSGEWSRVYICFDNNDLCDLESIFEQGIAKDCFEIQQLPVFTSVKQAKEHANYYYEQCLIIELSVPQSVIYSWQSYLRLQPTVISPETIAGCYVEAKNAPCYIQNPKAYSKFANR